MTKKPLNHPPSLLRSYYNLTKPGIIRGNLISTIAGFFLASQLEVQFAVLTLTLLGTALVIASGCVFNNILDRTIDSAMQRTQHRATVTGVISVRSAFVYGSLLGFGGLYILAAFVNILTALVGAFGLLAYVVLYGIAKRTSIHGTLIGSISGAIPPVAGYTAVTNQLDATAALLFLCLVAWQMPHFYAIAIFRARDYKKAAIPVLPLKRSFQRVYVEILGYAALFLVVSVALGFYSRASELYIFITIAASLWWLGIIQSIVTSKDAVVWSKQVFGASLIVLLVWCVAIILDVYL